MNLRRTLLTACLFASLLPFSAAFAQAPPAVPALPDSERRTAYTISASTCACNVNFALFSTGTDVDNWIQVWVNGSRKLSTDPTFGWSLSSATGSLSTIPRPITDAVLTFNSAQTATIQIVGADRPRQLTQFTEGRGVAARDLNQRFTEDRAIQREVWDKINDVTGRSILSQPGNTMGPLPLPAGCANAFLGFDGTGLNPQCSTSAGTGTGGIVGVDTLFGSGRPWCDPRSKGAKGDGSTDDTAAISACVTQLAATNGGILYFSPGVYCTATGITLNGASAIVLLSVGWNSALSACTSHVTPLTINSSYNEVHNIAIIGDNAVSSTHDAISIGSSCTECFLDRVSVSFGRYSINVAATFVHLKDVQAADAYGGALIYTTGGYSCTNCKLDQGYPVSTPAAGTTYSAWASGTPYTTGTVVSTGGYLIQARNNGTSSSGSAPTLQPYGTNIQDNVTGSCPAPSAGVCWLLVGQTTYAATQIDTGSNDVQLIQSDMTGSFTYGVYMSNSLAGTAPNTVVVTDSFIGSAHDFGFYQQAGSNVTLKGTQITGCIGSGCGAFYGHPGKDDTLVGNIIFNNPNGFEFDQASNNLTVADNIISNASGDAIFIAGTTTMASITGNLVGGSVIQGNNANGIVISTAATDYLWMAGNQCHNATTCQTNNSTGTHNLIETTPGIFNTPFTFADGGIYGSGGINGSNIGATTPGTGAFTTLAASSTVSGTGFSTYLASPPAIGGTAPNTGKFTTLTDTGLSTQGVVCNSAAGLLSTSVTWCAGAVPARNQTLPSNPSGTTSSTPVMAGLSSGTTRFTPVTSGNMLFTISGTAQNTNSGNGCVVIIRYGTGNGPANAASSTGTTAGAASGQQATSNSAGGNVPFSITAYATGLTLNTAYYYDLAFNAVTGGTCSLTNITMTAMEM